MLQANTVLKELDVSSNAKGYSWEDPSGFATGISKGLSGNGALSVLSLKKNALGTKEAGKVLGEMLKENSVLKELDLSDNRYYSSGWKTDPEFAEELAAGIKDNGALTKLDISSNFIGAEQRGELQRICVAGNIELAT
jgi:Ran GTPase-activating protein (RanGAP) involved in mRNA processing and transport